MIKNDKKKSNEIKKGTRVAHIYIYIYVHNLVHISVYRAAVRLMFRSFLLLIKKNKKEKFFGAFVAICHVDRNLNKVHINYD